MIKLENICKSYDEKTVLDNIMAEFPDDSITCIMGESGAGKTTLVNLIERFYEVNIGEIIFDDKVEIHDLTRACLRENIAMVLQDTWVYKGTIGDNLKYGLKREITEEEFRNACRETFVDQFVSTLPDGYQTVISNETSG